MLVLLSLSVDQSKQRREVVRRKTAEYLKHAEELYQKHLAPSSKDQEKVSLSLSSFLSLSLSSSSFVIILLSPLCLFLHSAVPRLFIETELHAFCVHVHVPLFTVLILSSRLMSWNSSLLPLHQSHTYCLTSRSLGSLERYMYTYTHRHNYLFESPSNQIFIGLLLTTG